MDGLPADLALREIGTAIERLPVSADAKVILFRLSEVTVQVGNRLVAIGRQILSFVLDAVHRFPNTSFGLVISVVVTLLIGSVAILGGLLAPLIGPLLVALGVGMGALADIHNDALRHRILAFEARAKAAIDG